MREDLLFDCGIWNLLHVESCHTHTRSLFTEAARKAREKEGIPSRRTNATLEIEEERTLKSLTVRELKELLAQGTDDDDSVPEDSPPRKLVPVTTDYPDHLLQSPPPRPLVTTQRQVAYQNSDRQQPPHDQSNKKRKKGPR